MTSGYPLIIYAIRAPNELGGSQGSALSLQTVERLDPFVLQDLLFNTGWLGAMVFAQKTWGQPWKRHVLMRFLMVFMHLFWSCWEIVTGNHDWDLLEVYPRKLWWYHSKCSCDGNPQTFVLVMIEYSSTAKLSCRWSNNCNPWYLNTYHAIPKDFLVQSPFCWLHNKCHILLLLIYIYIYVYIYVYIYICIYVYMYIQSC